MHATSRKNFPSETEGMEVVNAKNRLFFYILDLLSHCAMYNDCKLCLKWAFQGMISYAFQSGDVTG